MRHLKALAPAALLAGCAYPSPEHVARLNGFIGRPEIDLIRAEGVPTRTYMAGGSRFLAYDESRLDTIPGTPGIGFYGWGGWGGPWYGPGWGGFGGTSPEVVTRSCATTFELAGGIVRRWTVKGNDC